MACHVSEMQVYVMGGMSSLMGTGRVSMKGIVD